MVLRIFWMILKCFQSLQLLLVSPYLLIPHTLYFYCKVLIFQNLLSFFFNHIPVSWNCDIYQHTCSLYYYYYHHNHHHPFLSTFCRCRELLLYFITLNDTHTQDRAPLDEGSVRGTDLYLTIHNTLKRQTSMLFGRIPTWYPSMRASAHPLLRPRGRWDRFDQICDDNTAQGPHDKDQKSMNTLHKTRSLESYVSRWRANIETAVKTCGVATWSGVTYITPTLISSG
jgi:hypothetical protein